MARWSSKSLGGTATTMLNHASTASYTGLTVASRSGVSVMYLANSRGEVEAYNARTFQRVQLPAGAFTDPNIPAGYTPYNVQAIGSKIYVTFTSGGLGGYVDAFDVNGKLLLSLQNGAWMAGPWGIALAPVNFGKYSKTLLIGNHGSGRIYAFNPATEKMLGAMTASNGKPLTNVGLWGIGFGSRGAAGAPNTLYFAAGISGGGHGLFGAINGD